MTKKDEIMKSPIRILLQTTIPFTEDDWHIGRFSLLRDELSSRKDESGNSLFQVTTRDRESDPAGNDPVLSSVDTSEFDELWLFAVDTGEGLTKTDCQGITRFRQRGGGILATRGQENHGGSCVSGTRRAPPSGNILIAETWPCLHLPATIIMQEWD